MRRRVQHSTSGLWAALAMASSVAAHAQPTPDADAAEDAPAHAATWTLRLSAEFGMGSRGFDLPMDGVVYQTRTGLVPAAGLGFELDHAASDAIALGLLVRYQSSFVHPIREQHVDGSEHPLDVRSQRLELAFAPTFRLDGSGDWVLLATAGYALSDFRPEAHHLLTPAYGLAGPYLRLELRLPQLFDTLRLRAGPEIQWIVDSGDDLAARGIAAHGLGLGGEAALEMVLGAHWMIHVTYREVRAWLDSSLAQDFEDVTRFVTARVLGQL